MNRIICALNIHIYIYKRLQEKKIRKSERGEIVWQAYLLSAWNAHHWIFFNWLQLSFSLLPRPTFLRSFLRFSLVFSRVENDQWHLASATAFETTFPLSNSHFPCLEKNQITPPTRFKKINKNYICHPSTWGDRVCDGHNVQLCMYLDFLIKRTCLHISCLDLHGQILHFPIVNLIFYQCQQLSYMEN